MFALLHHRNYFYCKFKDGSMEEEDLVVISPNTLIPTTTCPGTLLQNANSSFVKGQVNKLR